VRFQKSDLKKVSIWFQNLPKCVVNPRFIRHRVNDVLRIFQRNGLKLEKDLIFSEFVQNVYLYRMKTKKI